MESDQTAPLGADWSWSIVFASMITLVWSALNICSRHNKQTTFSGQKNIPRIWVNSVLVLNVNHMLADNSFETVNPHLH